MSKCVPSSRCEISQLLFVSQMRERRSNPKVVWDESFKFQVHSGGRHNCSLGFHGICVSGLFIIHGDARVPHQRCIPTAYRWDFKGAPQPTKQSYALFKWSHVRKLCHIFFFPLLGVNEAEFILRVMSSEGRTQSMPSERSFPARAFPFYGATLLTLHDLLIDVDPTGLSLFVEAGDEGRTTGRGGSWSSCWIWISSFLPP